METGTGWPTEPDQWLGVCHPKQEIPSPYEEENYVTLELDPARCVQVFHCGRANPDVLRAYFSSQSLSDGGEITWFWVGRSTQTALIEFKSRAAAYGVRRKPGHFIQRAQLLLSEPEWIEHRTVEITGLELSACKQLLKRRGFHELIENIQKVGNKRTLLTWKEAGVLPGLLSDRPYIPAGVKVIPYDHKRLCQFPFRILVRAGNKCSSKAVFDAFKLHIDLQETDIFEDLTNDAYLIQSTKPVDILTLKREIKLENEKFFISAVVVINCHPLRLRVVGEAPSEVPSLPTSVIRPGEGADVRDVDTDILKQHDELQNKYEECSAQRDSLEHEVKQLRESEARWKKAYEELMDAKTGCDGEVEKLQGKIKTLFSVKTEISNKYDELKNKYEESTAYGNRLEHQVKQLTETERNLQVILATLVESNEEVMRQKTGLEKMVEALQQEARASLSLREKVNCQERHLVEKTQQILKLEASLISQSGELCARLEALQAIPGMISRLEQLQAVPGMNSQLEPLQGIPETISQLERLQAVPEMISRLEPLQAIPGMISSQCQEIHSHITNTADKLLVNVNDASSRIVDKALKNAWVSFRQDDTSDDTEASFKSTGPKNIPSRLKCQAELLSCTVGPNWLDAGRALDLDGDHLARIRADWGQYGMRELTLRVIECWCSLSPDTKITLDALKTAMSRLEINPLMVEPMGEDDQRILTENHHLLLRDMMDVTHIESYLRQAKILSASAVEYIIYPSTSRRRIQRLLKVLPFSGSRALCEFRTALLESGQTHIALELAGIPSSATKTERDITQGVLVKHLETKKTDVGEILDVLALNVRAGAEMKQGIFTLSEELEKWVFRGSRVKCQSCCSSFGKATSEKTEMKKVD